MDESIEKEIEKEKNETEKEEKRNDLPGARRRTVAVIILSFAMLLFGLFLGYTIRPLVGPEFQATKQTATARAVAMETRIADNKELMNYLIENSRHSRGDPEASVTVIEFSDFQCPYCGIFATGAGRQIDEEYVQKGKVRFIYWNYAFLGDESKWAAESSECAADQGKFWEYHDILFARAKGENQGAFSKENLTKLAKELGLDIQIFSECMESGKYTEKVEKDSYIATQIGVRSTPSFMVNGEPVVGAQPFEEFKKVIDKFLAQ